MRFRYNGGMKLAITGKGGTGKTTVAGLLARFYADDGFRVLAVDADPDANLASAIGLPEKTARAIVPISMHRRLVRERTGADPGRPGQMFKVNPTVADIADAYGIDHRGIKLLVMGGIQSGGAGCACPENTLLRNLLSEIILNRDEVVIVDMEAGIEHLGRATSRAIDLMVIVVEPGSRSLNTAETIMRLAREIGVKSFGIVGNKIRNDDEKRWLEARFPRQMILGLISDSDIIRDSDLQRAPLADRLDEGLRKEFEAVYRACRSVRPSP
jgi:CO dehydrogenase maturation factor